MNPMYQKAFIIGYTEIHSVKNGSDLIKPCSQTSVRLAEGSQGSHKGILC